MGIKAPPEYLDRFNNLAVSTCGQYQLSQNCEPGEQRKSVAAIVSAMDDGIGEIVAALTAANMSSNTLIVFSTDNGGPTNGSNSNNANNWPL